jgi:hypothetical protein
VEPNYLRGEKLFSPAGKLFGGVSQLDEKAKSIAAEGAALG